ncbi:MAG TPA: hypothetical protein VMV72_00035 [Verrucomicrobiae bacterium]|nr:hypothetical protein [Verrucomicrobiae bacterium]
MSTPRFHTLGKPSGDFYAVAYVPGTYTPRSGQPHTEAFYVLNLSLSHGFTRFSHLTESIDGCFLAYSRGEDKLDTIEHAVLDAWHKEHVPPYAWHLFPVDAVEEDKFRGDAVLKSEYQLAQRRLGRILWRARVSARSSVKPLFGFNETSALELLADRKVDDLILKMVLGDQVAGE